MPTYTYDCSNETCGAHFETLNTIANRHYAECPQCGKLANKCVDLVSIRPDVHSWANENNGRGRYITQLQTSVGAKRDPGAYCRSQQEVIDKARARGMTVEKTR